MSDQITLEGNIQNNITLLSNEFIDEHMVKADGEYVKIYLMILRLSSSGTQITPDLLADRLELTRKDVLRAIHYWENEGVLKAGVTEKEEEQPEEAREVNFIPNSVPIKLMLSPLEMEEAMEDSDFERTLFMAETYIGRPFSSTEVNGLCYIHDQLGFSTELMDYLIEYCVGRGKKSIRYIEKVAVSWYQDHITTVQEARERNRSYSHNAFAVMKAFGISGRNPGSSEIQFIKEWDAMGFAPEIIEEACNRTLVATHQPSFPYANKILLEWKRQQVRSLEDIRALDEKYQGEKGREKLPVREGKGKNAFHNFDERSYDYDSIEMQLKKKTRV